MFLYTNMIRALPTRFQLPAIAAAMPAAMPAIMPVLDLDDGAAADDALALL
jgi:hypothetical protein